jgi:hypothetical protein
MSKVCSLLPGVTNAVAAMGEEVTFMTLRRKEWQSEEGISCY